MIKDYIGNISDNIPGLALHMLDVLADRIKCADKPSEFVARAQDIYLDWSILYGLQYLQSFVEYMSFCCNPDVGADL